MAKDKNMEGMVETLLSGGKMLSRHCPKCNMPLFEYKGKIICSNCGVEFVEKGEEEVKAGRGLEKVEPSPALSQTVQEKLEELGKRLNDETDPEEISKILVAMESALKVLRKLELR